MQGHGAKFGHKKEEAIAALFTQRSVEEAARAVGVDPNTLLRWLKIPEFQAAYRERAALRSANPSRDFNRRTSAAATTLLKIMVDPTAPASCRLRAADSVLGHAAKAIEIEDIEARVSKLEQSGRAEEALASAP